MTDWTTPKTWNTGELVTAADLNTQVRDNLTVLKHPPSAQAVMDQGADYLTTAGTWVPVDANLLSAVLVTHGGDVMVHFHAQVRGEDGIVFLDVAVDGTRHAGDDGIVRVTNGAQAPVSFTRLITGLDPGEHEFTLMWCSSDGRIYAGSGAFNYDLHGQFWAREVS